MNEHDAPLLAHKVLRKAASLVCAHWQDPFIVTKATVHGERRRRVARLTWPENKIGPRVEIQAIGDEELEGHSFAGCPFGTDGTDDEMSGLINESAHELRARFVPVVVPFAFDDDGRQMRLLARVEWSLSESAPGLVVLDLDHGEVFCRSEIGRLYELARFDAVDLMPTVAGLL